MDSSVLFFPPQIKEATEKLVQPLTAFIKLDLSVLKDLKKKYEKASLEYSQILAKIESLQSHKKLDMVKLYSAEKERVRLKKIFDEATEALQTHCDDVQDRLGFDFLEWMISFMRAQKTMFGFVYGELQEIKEYLDELHTWCKEEAFIFEDHKRERDQLQSQALEAEHLEHIKQFLKVTNISSLNLSLSHDHFYHTLYLCFLLTRLFGFVLS
jgi:Arf-GAP/coiled-coil/ANK repeat/PH domain-containing protein